MQLKGNSKKLTDFRKETYWLMPIRRPRISHFRKFCFGDIFLSFGDISVSFGGIFYSTRQKKEAPDKNRLNFRKWFKYGLAPHALKGQKLLAQGSALGMMAISKTP